MTHLIVIEKVNYLESALALKNSTIYHVVIHTVRKINRISSPSVFNLFPLLWSVHGILAPLGFSNFASTPVLLNAIYRSYETLWRPDRELLDIVLFFKVVHMFFFIYLCFLYRLLCVDAQWSILVLYCIVFFFDVKLMSISFLYFVVTYITNNDILY